MPSSGSWPAAVFDQVIIATEDPRARLARLHEREESKKKTYTVHPRPTLSNAYVAPRNELETQIAEIWQERMGIEQVGVNDNFFELGGDSLLIVKVRAAMGEVFGGEMLTSDLFENPTVAALGRVYRS